MVTKNAFALTLIFVAVLSSLSIASAVIAFNPTDLKGTLEQGKTLDVKFKITSTDSSNTPALDLTSVVYEFSNLTLGSNILLSTNQQILNAPTTIKDRQETELTYRVVVPSNQVVGVYTGTLNIKGTLIGTSQKSIPIELTITPTSSLPPFKFCSAGNVGDLRITDIDIANLGVGEDDAWEPLDEIEITVDVKNTHSKDRVSNVLVRLLILDRDGNDVTNDFDFEDDEIDLGSIRDGETESAVFKIKELPTDLDEESYKIYVKAFSEGDEEIQCADVFSGESFQEIDYTRQDDQAVVIRDQDLQNVVLTTCGAVAEVTFPVYNLGTDKEDGVLVSINNKELGIVEFQSISNLRAGKNKDMSFALQIPTNAIEKRYTLNIVTYFDYDNDEDEMDVDSYDLNSEDDLDENYRIFLDVLSCKAKDPSVTASLSSSAVIGEDLVIKVTVKNNDKDSSATFSTEGLDSWADVVSITPQSTELLSGESKEVTLTLKPKVAGSQSFGFVSIINGETFRKTIEVTNIAEPTSSNGIFSNFKGNTVAYLIIAIAAILILILLVLIVRASSRKA